MNAAKIAEHNERAHLIAPRAQLLSCLSTLLCLLLIPLLSTAANPQGTASVPEVDRSKEILQRAGATAEELDNFGQYLLGLTADNRARVAADLRRQSPAGLAKAVEYWRYDSHYVLGPESLPQHNVPKGEILEFELTDSRIFPGTTRKISVYIPAQYNADQPACSYVSLDGFLFELPTVFDNLISKNAMPITIAVGISAGEVPSAAAPASPRFNRSFEFDGMTDDLAKFVLEEVFPEVERRTTRHGLPIRLSSNPNDRAAGGLSTGGIGSFTLAWTRPDAFRRVFTASGTFVGMRGGDRYPILVRKTEPKPIRIFMQDGSRDNLDGILGELGDWWMSNQTMQRALEFSGYEVSHVWGEGPHGSKQASVVFPDAMRWLWKGWPHPIAAGESKNVFLHDILRRGNEWEIVTEIPPLSGPIAADVDGSLAIWDANSSKGLKLSTKGSIAHSSITYPYAGIVIGPDRRTYVIDVNTSSLIAYSEQGKPTTITRDVQASNLVVSHRGNVYMTEPGQSEGTGKVWLVKADGRKVLLDEGLNHPTAIALTPDELWLAVAERGTPWGYSYRVEPDHTARKRQRFYWFHTPDDASDPGTSSWAMDSDGRLYAGTRMGVQVFDRNGRVRAILPVPGGSVRGLAFGGPSFETLFVTTADKRLYKRRLRVRGVHAAATPVILSPSNAT